jgi:NAD(P)H-hydrate repair Nnr-like enzyme with NAD(P)H-hydrate dehydratase domain
MDADFWQKQTKGKPLFPDLIWSRPEHRTSAGKLLIIGGNAHGFAAPAEAYQESIAAGAGATRVLMPVAVKKIAGKLFETVDYAPSTPSGSFSKNALLDMLEHANWADGVVLAGDLGRNSETAIAIEKFLTSFSGHVTLTKDAADYAINQAESTIQRPNTLLVLTIAQLQKLFINARLETPITFSMGLLQLVDQLHDLGEKYPANILVKHLDQYIVSSQGFVSTTRTDTDNEDFWRVKVAVHASVWWLQNPNKSYESLTTSLI